MTCSSQHHHLTLYLLLSLIATAFAATSFQPKALLLPVSKDASTLQYIVKTTQRTPSKFVPLTLSLGSPFLWQNCDKGYVSSTYRPARCESAPCKLASSTACGTCNAPPRPGCNNNTCGLFPNNPFIDTTTSGELASDLLRINSTDGSNLGPNASVPDILFSCAPTSLLKGLAKGVQGIAGFGRASKISIPSQLLSTFKLAQNSKKFAFCLTSDFLSSDGVIFFGDGPYRLYPSLDISTDLSYTPFLANPSAPSEYFIGVKAIKIQGQKTEVKIDKNLLSGGALISTVHPYTVMQSSIFEAVTTAFDKQLKIFYSSLSINKTATRVKAVAPFKVCYESSSLSFSRPGIDVPSIKLVLQSSKVAWTIDGHNSMIGLNNGVECLALVDGGEKPSNAIVIGGYQLEDNILQFDLAKSTLGFRFLYDTRCSNFNFTYVA